MSEEMEALARRAVACPGWRWLEGSQDARGFQVLCRSSVDVDVYTGGEEIRRFPWSQWQTEAVPNLRAPATLGCMASLVQAHLAEMADRDAAHYHGLRVAIAWRDWLMGWRDDRALAMVAALEVDPAKVAP